MSDTARAVLDREPSKLFFRIGEVSRLLGVKAHVIRYWESEFPSIRPEKSESGHRRYRRRDVEVLFEIRRLLHEERHTVAGAKQKLRALASAAPREDPQRELLVELREGLRELVALTEG